MALNAVIFDIHGTLIHSEGGTLQERTMEGLRGAHRVLSEGGVPLPDFRTTFSMVYHEMSRASAGLVFGNFREMSIPKMVKEFIQKAFPDVKTELVEDALSAWYEPIASCARPAPGAGEALKGVRRLGLKTGGAGNTPWGGKFLRKDLERAGLLEGLDALIGSADVGYRKPNLYLLTEVLKRLGVRGEDTLHVGDDPREDVEAPQELNMRAVLIAPPGSVPRADATIPSLFALEELLREWKGK
ncbi:MAG: HAD family hydrolase [Planctomycetota bacterium]|jgi:FMN phosphatase YigB (HAD superfamily)